MSGRWNQRHSAVRRIQQELKELQRDDDPDIYAEAIEDNIFEWHFVIRGAWDSEFEGGIYHGRILMPAEYPFKPPAFVMLTPSGRFETGVKICLSISSHHPESWQPSWSVRSALVALVAFMQTPGNGALGSLDHSAEVRRQMAAESRLHPPAYGDSERRELLASMHQRMVDMEERSRAGCNQEKVADVGSNDAGASSSSTTAGPEADSRAPHAEAAHSAKPPAQQAATLEASPAPAVTPTEVASASVAPPTLPVAPATPAEPEVRQRAALAASPVAPPAPAPAPVAAEVAPPLRNQHQHLNHHQSWEDRGLTYLAVLLALCIAALIVRKVFVTFSFNSDDLYNFNHVEGVEL